ncbi:hypothetical protein CcaCcLH18_14097 [Colletotrichum camelliae]|nr:hypothetical protein CcaCcLH18_14097 [Colletotrichum camelliae]
MANALTHIVRNLPIELRYMVYELNFVGLPIYRHRKEGICINEKDIKFYYYGPSDRNGYRTTTSLLRTCKTIHQEATKWLYARDFYVIQLPLDIDYCDIGQMGRLLDWLKKIGPKNRSYLRSITFKNKDNVGVWTLTSNNGGGNYRTCSFSVAKLLADSANLQKLTTLHFYNTRRITNTWARPPLEESKSKNWTYRACMTAEIMYKDFRPMISQAIKSGRPLDDILNLLMPDEKSFEWYDIDSEWARIPRRWTQEQADEAKASMAEHMMLLLEKNLAYQRKRGWVQN